MPGAGHPQPQVLAAPDKLKGTLGAAGAAAAVEQAAAAAGWRADACPLSDGGEGFADVLASLGGEVRETTVSGPLGAPVTARWRMAGDQAVVESAAASGLVLAGGRRGNDPVRASSRGTGELLVAAASAGARRILVGVGGSAMTDGGSGAVEAVEECGGLGQVEVVVACDVTALFVDAAERFGPQKGADPGQVGVLRARLEDLAGRYRQRYGVDVSSLAGSGAAGGLAGGLAALGATLVPGFDLVAGVVGLEARVAGADLVVTAEGRLDASSWDGKVVGGVVELARRHGRPAVVVAGTTGDGGAGEAARRGVEVLDLAARFGVKRARHDTAACIAAMVGEVLRRVSG